MSNVSPVMERRQSIKVSYANKDENRWKQKKEISNSLLSHTHALVIAVSQKNTHFLPNCLA